MSSQQQLPPPNSARLAITSLCNVLRHYGVALADPETIRQAKFDGPVVGPMWRILHDTVLVVLAGCRDSSECQATLQRQWGKLSLELAGGEGDEGFPQEGVALVLRQLAVWGAPTELLRDLAPHITAAAAAEAAADTGVPDPCAQGVAPARSRPLLLALGWLVAAAGLFERRVLELEPGVQVRALLPPYPQDSCTSPAVQATYDTAAQDALDHVRRLPAGGTAAAAAASNAGGGGVGARVGGHGSSGSGGGVLPRGRPPPVGDPFGPSPGSLAAEAVWADVEAAAQRAAMLCGRVRSRMVALQAAMDCRHRLTHSLWTRQSAASPSTRPLTPYELQLCAQPGLVQRHMAALEAATVALLEQQELAAHGSLFFEWMGSVLHEEQHQRHTATRGQQQHRHLDVNPASSGNSTSARDGRGKAGPLASLEHLPYVGSEAANRLAAHLQAQLEGAMQAAEPELAAARRRLAASAAPVPTSSTPSATSAARPPPAVTLQHFLALAEQAVPERLPYTEADLSIDGDPGLPGDHSSGSSARAGAGLGVRALAPSISFPGALCGAADMTDDDAAVPPWRLPDDIAAALTAVQQTQRRQRCTTEEEVERFHQLRYATLLRYDFSGPPGGFGGGAAPGGGCGGPLASVMAAAAGGTASGGPSVAASDETQRLLAAVLAAARPLARTRASHKAALLAALQELPEGYLVAGV